MRILALGGESSYSTAYERNIVNLDLQLVTRNIPRFGQLLWCLFDPIPHSMAFSRPNNDLDFAIPFEVFKVLSVEIQLVFSW